MIEHLSTAVVVLGPDLRTLDLNPAGESLFSISARAVIGQPVTRWLPGALDLQAMLEDARDQGQPWTGRELSLALSGGLHPITVDLTVTPLDDGRLVLEFTGLDRHRRITREDQLQHQHEATQALVRGLAHEIKNPLGGIRGAAQLLERRLDDPSLREYTAVIIREADRLAAMVDALLGPRNLPRLVRVNLHEVIEHALRLVENEFPALAAIRREYDPSIPELKADADQLQQAVLNILRNSVQASPIGEDITVRTRIERQVTIGGRRHRQVACIDVIDRGDGIAPDLLDSIFFPMVTTRPGGTGLGLPIAQGLIARHGGLVECESEAGRTQFTIMLPLENDDG